MADQHHPVHHKKFSATQATEALGVIVIAIMGLAMLVGLLTASGKGAF